MKIVGSMFPVYVLHRTYVKWANIDWFDIEVFGSAEIMLLHYPELTGVRLPTIIGDEITFAYDQFIYTIYVKELIK